MHYNDQIYCAAGKIVIALQDESRKRGFTLDDELGGGFASLHVRRGDLQVCFEQLLHYSMICYIMKCNLFLVFHPHNLQFYF